MISVFAVIMALAAGDVVWWRVVDLRLKRLRRGGLQGRGEDGGEKNPCLPRIHHDHVPFRHVVEGDCRDKDAGIVREIVVSRIRPLSRTRSGPTCCPTSPS